MLSRKPGRLLRGVAFQGEFNKPVQQVTVWNSCILPHLRIHADRRKARDGIDFIDEQLASGGFTQEIHPAHAFATHGGEAGHGQAAHFCRVFRGKLGGEFNLREVQFVFVFIVVELAGG